VNVVGRNPDRLTHRRRWHQGGRRERSRRRGAIIAFYADDAAVVVPAWLRRLIDARERARGMMMVAGMRRR